MVFARLRSWFLNAFRRSSLNDEIADELRLHAELHAERLIRGGMPADTAYRLARAELGGLRHPDPMRDALGLRALDDLRNDLRYAWRGLRRSPTFAIVAILTLALGIGANAAIFSLVEAALWKPLTVRSPEDLRLLTWVSG